MTKNKISDKYNESCIRIFKLMSLLAQGETPFADVIKLFADENGNTSQISNVVLNKYMNTLKIYGVKVKKSKNIYHLLSMPFSITLNEHDLYAVALIKSATSYLPNGKTKTNITTFIEDIEKRYDFNTKQLSTIVNSARNYDLSFYFKKFEKQISECEKHCNEGYNIQISYINKNVTTLLVCVPQEIKYIEKNVYLSVYDPNKLQTIDIPINSINSIAKLKEKTDDKKKKVYTPVIFKLKGDLAKRYKLRDWEKINEVMDNGDIIVSNSGEDMQILLTRLFKYGKNCVVLSPKYMRKRLIKLVEKCLKNYE